MTTELPAIEHPSAWVGDSVKQFPEWNLSFDRRELDELLSFAECSTARFDIAYQQDPTPPSFRAVGDKLRGIQRALEHGTGVVRISGLSVDSLAASFAKQLFWLICRGVGTPVSQSAKGQRLFDVQDAGLPADDQRARGPNTRKRLSFHTDRCDAIAFLCFRQAKSGGENLIVSSASLFNQMRIERPDLLQVLMQPFLYKRHNVDQGNTLNYVQQPIFSIHQGHFAANLLRVLIERAYAMPDTPNMTIDQREALDYLEDMAERDTMHARYRLQPGDILLLNNFVTFHRRTAFVDHEAVEQRRHLFRVWLSMSNSRPLSPSFAGNYGNTEAGAVRGGMLRETPPL